MPPGATNTLADGDTEAVEEADTVAVLEVVGVSLHTTHKHRKWGRVKYQ